MFGFDNGLSLLQIDLLLLPRIKNLSICFQKLGLWISLVLLDQKLLKKSIELRFELKVVVLDEVVLVELDHLEQLLGLIGKIVKLVLLEEPLDILLYQPTQLIRVALKHLFNILLVILINESLKHV